MKIYNEVTSIFNETTGKWETISEDSFEYGGTLMMLQDNSAEYDPSLDANQDGVIDSSDEDLFTSRQNTTSATAVSNLIGGGNVMFSDVPVNATNLDTREGWDKVTDTIKTTAGYFTNGAGTLAGNTIYTGSLANSNEIVFSAPPPITAANGIEVVITTS